MKLFIKQPIKKFRQANKVNSVWVLLFIWILFSTTLTTCFTCLLRSTYFWKNPTVLVDSLQDIINNPALSVAGMKGLREIDEIKPSIYRNLRKRFRDYKRKMRIHARRIDALAKPEVISDVNEGKAVLILDSNHANRIQKLYPNYRLKQSKRKYKQRFAFSYVTRGQSYSEPIFKM